MYNAEYFINFYSAIPEEKFCTFQQHDGKGAHCCYGHLDTEEEQRAGVFGGRGHHTERGVALNTMLKKLPVFNTAHPVASINNGGEYAYPQATPKNVS